MSFDLGTVIKGVAPMLGTALLGPFGGMAARAIAGAVLPDGEQPPTDAPVDTIKDAIVKAIQGGTANMLGLKQAENDFAVKMAELGYRNAEALEKIAADDRASARHLQEVTRSRMPAILASAIVILYIGVQWFLLKGIIDVSMREIVMRSLGTLDAALGLVLSFYFGSSASSRSKDETIKSLSQ